MELRKLAVREREHATRTLLEDGRRIGTVSLERQGGEYKEKFINGTEFQALEQKEVCVWVTGLCDSMSVSCMPVAE